MEQFLREALGQAPYIVIFLAFLWLMEKSRQASVKDNHEEWRNLLKELDENNKAWIADQNKHYREFFSDQQETWRKWLETRDVELMATLRQLLTQTGQLIEILQGMKK